MQRKLKSIMWMWAGLCWFAFSAILAWYLFRYLVGGAVTQLFGSYAISSTTALVGLIHVVGFVFASVLCFVVGIALFFHGFDDKAAQAQVPEE